jgi:nucleoside diphosphate kinase
MTNKEKLQTVLSDHGGDLGDAAAEIYAGSKALAIYAIELALNHLKARTRATRRREIRRVVQPQFKPGRVTGSFVLTDAAKRRLVKETQTLFSKDGWNIGEINIGDFTREDLLEHAAKERKSAKGHIRNAQFYEALAEPMAAGQKVSAYWKPDKALKVREDIWKNTESKSPALVP